MDSRFGGIVKLKVSQIMQLALGMWLLVATMLAAASPLTEAQRPVARMVVATALEVGVAPHLALAIARTESNFDPAAVSHRGAIGVMQLMPATARGEFAVARHDLFDPQINIRTGLLFFRQLYDRYGREDIALSHYNGGSSVDRGQGRYRVIPATREYVRTVQSRARAYRESAPIRRLIADVATAGDLYSYRTVKAMPASERSVIISRLRALVAKNNRRGHSVSTQSEDAQGLSLREKIRIWESYYD